MANLYRLYTETPTGPRYVSRISKVWETVQGITVQRYALGCESRDHALALNLPMEIAIHILMLKPHIKWERVESEEQD